MILVFLCLVLDKLDNIRINFVEYFFGGIYPRAKRLKRQMCDMQNAFYFVFFLRNSRIMPIFAANY